MVTLNSPLDGSRRIPQLDGLRGIAIAMVVAYHYAAAEIGPVPRFPIFVSGPLNLGWSGVDLFFVLSGFLIGGILLDARESSNYFRVFYTRRVCRIFPVYFTFLVLFFIAAHFSRSPELQHVFGPSIPWLACATFTQNFWMAIRHSGGGAALNPIWSLAVEEQFYLTLPALIYFVPPRRLIWFLTAGILLAPLIRLSIFLTNPRQILAIAFLLPCRMDSLLFGVTAAYFLRQPGRWEFVRARRRHLWTVLEVLTGVCAFFLLSPSTYSPPMMLVGFDCLGLFYTAVLMLALVDDVVAGFLRTKWLMSLGTISYCVYLIHQLVFAETYLLLKGHASSWASTAIPALVFTILIARLSWEVVEKPLVGFGHRESYQLSPSR
jgi:peptidoglycan/LPS O-acetylase OafA/YrhL